MAVTSVAAAQLVGAVLFAIGSAFFVWSAWADDWLTPLRVGCALWIGGCVPYLWPPLRLELRGKGLDRADHTSNVLQVCGMLSWAVGSAFAFHNDLDLGLEVTNGGYLAGSACLLCDALLQARELCSSVGDERVSLLADVLAGLFYVLAGGFGGYATELALIRFGNCCWLVGSLISGVRPCLALSAPAARRRGRAACASVPPPAEAARGTASAVWRPRGT